MQVKVKWFYGKKGYGFAESPDGDIMIHASAACFLNKETGKYERREGYQKFVFPRGGDTIEVIEVEKSEKGMRASAWVATAYVEPEKQLQNAAE